MFVKSRYFVKYLRKLYIEKAKKNMFDLFLWRAPVPAIYAEAYLEKIWKVLGNF